MRVASFLILHILFQACHFVCGMAIKNQSRKCYSYSREEKFGYMTLDMVLYIYSPITMFRFLTLWHLSTILKVNINIYISRVILSSVGGQVDFQA